MCSSEIVDFEKRSVSSLPALPADEVDLVSVGARLSGDPEQVQPERGRQRDSFFFFEGRDETSDSLYGGATVARPDGGDAYRPRSNSICCSFVTGPRPANPRPFRRRVALVFAYVRDHPHGMWSVRADTVNDDLYAANVSERSSHPPTCLSCGPFLRRRAA